MLTALWTVAELLDHFCHATPVGIARVRHYFEFVGITEVAVSRDEPERKVHVVFDCEAEASTAKPSPQS